MRPVPLFVVTTNTATNPTAFFCNPSSVLYTHTRARARAHATRAQSPHRFTFRLFPKSSTL
jgi:hypothetical protein